MVLFRIVFLIIFSKEALTLFRNILGYINTYNDTNFVEHLYCHFLNEIIDSLLFSKGGDVAPLRKNQRRRRIGSDDTGSQL